MANGPITGLAVPAIQNGTTRTMITSWLCSNTNLDHYEVVWEYTSGEMRDGHFIWLSGGSNNTTLKNDTYDAPANAKVVRVKVRPISKTYVDSNKVTRYYWTFSFSAYQAYRFTIEDTPPATPSTPTVTIDGSSLIAEVDVYDAPTKTIQFQLYEVLSETDGRTITSVSADVKANHAAWLTTIGIGRTYKVRCRASNGDIWSDWSQYSAEDTTIPFKPARIAPLCCL